ncbi:hypothetical protein LPJ59_002579 [Coemansia sp. RSA 2399]|nr:hypothetical protein LPJ59_002579 [Coemansia sp. RSA 2399]KAJ1895550.1 hypothetical protein LPJ81_004934 [Coemansia sp. IMI 209127]
MKHFSSALFLLALPSACLAGCENPATFKKCVSQTRAEVNICGINMTCKCVRQENVIRCYEKCGEDDHYLKLKLGEQGQRQIFCSQKRPGEPDDLPIIGSDGPSFHDAKKTNKKKESNDSPHKDSAPQKQQQPAVPPPMVREGSSGSGGRVNDMGPFSSGGGNNGGMIRNADIDGAANVRPAIVATVLAMAGALYAMM